jgi:hypothetical protein
MDSENLISSMEHVISYPGVLCLMTGVSSIMGLLEHVWYESNASLLSADKNGVTPEM